MNSDDSFSAETLNAFVDNQLSPDEKERIYLEMERNSELAHYICRLRTTHELIHDAYDAVLLPRPRPAHRENTNLEKFCRAVAVVLLLIAGGVVGWMGRAQLGTDDNLSTFASSSTTTQQEQDVLLHISSGSPTRINRALNDAEQMLRRAHLEGRKLTLEILANEDGLNLFNADNNAYAKRVAQLKHDYNDVRFLACAKTLQRLKEKGVHYNLVPQAQIVPSALDEIVGRMEKGWVYIRV